METAQREQTSRNHSNLCMFPQATLFQSTYHQPSRAEYKEATRFPLPGSNFNSRHRMTTKPMEMSVSSKATMVQRRLDLLMVQTERVDSLLPFTPPSLLIRSELMESMSSRARWATGWEVQIRLLLRLNRVSRVRCMSPEVPVCPMLLLRTSVLL